MSDLERLHLTDLAVRCQRVVDNPSMYPATAEKARKPKLEWAKLQEPPRPSLKEQQELERQQADLKARMIAFLRDI